MTLLDVRRATEEVGLGALVLGALLLCVWVYRVHTRLRRERASRVAAERAAAHAQRVAQLTAALGRARSASAAIEASVQESLHALRADAAMLLLVAEDGRAAHVARAVGYEPVPA